VTWLIHSCDVTHSHVTWLIDTNDTTYSVGTNSQQIWVLPGESDRYRTRQVVTILRQVQNTTSCHNSGTINLNSIGTSTVRGHTPYKYPPRNAMQRAPVQIQTRSESPGATLPFPLRNDTTNSYMTRIFHKYDDLFTCVTRLIVMGWLRLVGSLK